MYEIGISTACFYPLETERALECLAGSDCQSVKMVEIFLNAHSELSRESVGAFQKTLSGYGMRVSALHPFTSCFEPFLLFSRYERRFSEGLTYYKRYFETAAALGAAFFVLHGDSRRSEIENGVFFERFHLLQEQARSYGVTVLLENVHLYKGADPLFLRLFSEELGDDAAFIFDIKQAVRSGFAPFEVLDAMGGKVCHVHLSDHDGRHNCLVPLSGAFDFDAFFQKLYHAGYVGDYIIEVYREAFQNTGELFLAAEKLTDMIPK